MVNDIAEQQKENWNPMCPGTDTCMWRHAKSVSRAPGDSTNGGNTGQNLSLQNWLYRGYFPSNILIVFHKNKSCECILQPNSGREFFLIVPTIYSTTAVHIPIL